MERQETKTSATGVVTKLNSQENVVILTANATLTAGDSGKTFLIGTDALVITLPSTELGLEFTFINSGAAGNNIVTISPQAADGIAGTITLASSVVTRVGTVDTDLVNTKATSTKGNAVKIVGTGVAGTGAYYIAFSTGIWA
ncbi:MAG TPA: hypothetical protein PLF17_10935 [Chitinophagaceae bacterium]|nr:hypothetical protein [Chitinophagaceae bacterium]HRA71211.1 hypothetical protein [Flavobacterium sp.]